MCLIKFKTLDDVQNNTHRQKYIKLYLTFLLPNLTPRREATSRSATQALYNILWNPEVYYRFFKNHPIAPILIQINSVHTTPSCLSKLHLILTFHQRLCFRSGLMTLPTKILNAFFFCTVRATCHANFILLNLIIQIILENSTIYATPHYTLKLIRT
jgi:hypothetical protein